MANNISTIYCRQLAFYFLYSFLFTFKIEYNIIYGYSVIKENKIVNNTNDNILRKNNIYDIYNIYHIILKYELIYIVKLVVFIIVVCTVFIRFDLFNPESVNAITKQDLIGTSTFAFTTTIDCVILAKSITDKLKGRINFIHLLFCLVMFVFCTTIILIHIEQIKLSYKVLVFCNIMNIVSCVSPLLELAYDTLLHLHNEIDNDYI